MNRERDFIDDLNEFTARGAVGEPDAIQITPPAPMLGDLFVVRCVGSVSGRLICTDGREWAVREGQRVAMLATGRVGLTYCDDQCDVIATVMVNPGILAPRLLEWRLPPSLDTTCRALRLDPQFENVDQARVRCKAPGQEWSESTALPVDVELHGVSGELQLELTLRSRHATLSPEAVAVCSKTIKVAHPSPRFAIEMPKTAPLGGQVQIGARIQWAVRAALRCAGHAVEINLAHPQKAVELALPPISAPAVGPLKVQLELWGLDGNRVVQENSIQVEPRRPSVQIWYLENGALAYRIAAAVPVAIELADPEQTIELPGATGAIECFYAGTTRAHLVVRDDAGRLRRFAIQIDPTRRSVLGLGRVASNSKGDQK